MTLNDIKNSFEERFHQKWTSLSVQYHFKACSQKVLGIPFSEVMFQLSNELNTDDINLFNSFFDRLEADEPLQHIVQETEFMGYPIICSPNALIPRPETEELVEAIIERTKSANKKFKILDLCTGTGCIAVALKKLVLNSEVFALDFFDETLNIAEENFKLNKTEIKLLKCNVLSELEMSGQIEDEFDIWVSNPPYIPESDKKLMANNVLNYEPHEALFVSNQDPLVFYRKIAEQAKNKLKNEGWLFFEIHEEYGKEMIALLEGLKFKNVKILTDMQGKDRIALGQN